MLNLFLWQSVAGLLAARVCADHFTSVVVVETEQWLTTEAGRSFREHEYRVTDDGVRIRTNPRSRVLQYTTQHCTRRDRLPFRASDLLTRLVYQSMSLTILRRLFPQIETEVARIDVWFV